MYETQPRQCRLTHTVYQYRVKKETPSGSQSRRSLYRSDKVRTCGLHVPNVARYQLRYTPEFTKYALFRYEKFILFDRHK